MLCGFGEESLVLQGCTGGFFSPGVQLQCQLTGEPVGALWHSASLKLLGQCSALFGVCWKMLLLLHQVNVFSQIDVFFSFVHINSILVTYWHGAWKWYFWKYVREMSGLNPMDFQRRWEEVLVDSFLPFLELHKRVMCRHTLFQSAELKQFLQLFFLILVTLCYIWDLNLVIFNVLSS